MTSRRKPSPIAWRRLSQVPAGRPLPWLYATARNCLANELRRQRAQGTAGLQPAHRGHPRPGGGEPGTLRAGGGPAGRARGAGHPAPERSGGAAPDRVGGPRHRGRGHGDGLLRRDFPGLAAVSRPPPPGPRPRRGQRLQQQRRRYHSLPSCQDGDQAMNRDGRRPAAARKATRSRRTAFIRCGRRRHRPGHLQAHHGQPTAARTGAEPHAERAPLELVLDCWPSALPPLSQRVCWPSCSRERHGLPTPCTVPGSQPTPCRAAVRRPRPAVRLERGGWPVTWSARDGRRTPRVPSWRSHLPDHDDLLHVEGNSAVLSQRPRGHELLLCLHRRCCELECPACAVRPRVVPVCPVLRIGVQLRCWRALPRPAGLRHHRQWRSLLDHRSAAGTGPPDLPAQLPDHDGLRGPGDTVCDPALRTAVLRQSQVPGHHRQRTALRCLSGGPRRPDAAIRAARRPATASRSGCTTAMPVLISRWGQA